MWGSDTVFQPTVRTSYPNLSCFWLFTSTDRRTNLLIQTDPVPQERGTFLTFQSFRLMELTLISLISQWKHSCYFHHHIVELTQPKQNACQRGKWVFWQSESLFYGWKNHCLARCFKYLSLRYTNHKATAGQNVFAEETQSHICITSIITCNINHRNVGRC